MKLAAAVLAIAAIACSARRVDAPKRRAVAPRFAERPLRVEVEGTTERRLPVDFTFVGLSVPAPFSQGDMRAVADAITRYTKLPVAPMPQTLPQTLCPTLHPDCMGRVGSVLGAQHLLWGTLVGGAEELEVAMYLLEVKTTRVVRRYREKLSLVELSHDTARELAERGRIAVLGTEQSTLLVESEVNGTLALDGVPQGKLKVPHTSIKVAAGRHRILIEANGYTTTEVEIDVPPSRFVRLVVRK